MSDTIVHSSPLSPQARPLFEGLAHAYELRYGDQSNPGGSNAELYRYPPEAFAPPLGDFLLLVREGRTIAGGAFMSHDDETAELKRIWTDSELRRQGLARRVVLALEQSATEQGYTRLYLTTGFRQPEAVALYLSLGFRPLFDTAADPLLYRALPFEKYIGARAGERGTTPLRSPAANSQAAVEEVHAIKEIQGEKIASRLAQRQAVALQGERI